VGGVHGVGRQDEHGDEVRGHAVGAVDDEDRPRFLGDALTHLRRGMVGSRPMGGHQQAHTPTPPRGRDAFTPRRPHEHERGVVDVSGEHALVGAVDGDEDGGCCGSRDANAGR
jgi:hypothetical protein